jgi:uncharacterized protein
MKMFKIFTKKFPLQKILSLKIWNPKLLTLSTTIFSLHYFSKNSNFLTFQASESKKQIYENLYILNVLQNWKKLVEICNEQLKKDPENIIILSYKLFALNELQEDEEEFNRISQLLLDKESSDSNEMYFLAQVNLTFGNLEKGIKLMKDSVDKGSPEAFVQYAIFLMDGFEGVEINKKEGIKLLNLAKKKGSKESLLVLAHYYEEMDPQKSFLYVVEAVDLDYLPAYKMLADYYFNGFGVNVDPESGMKYLKLSAEKGDSESLLLIANFHLEREEFDESLKYVQKANELGVDEALGILAGFYLFGLGTVKQNVKKGLKLLEEGLENGNASAKIVLGNLLVKGDLIERDEEKARQIFSQCALEGNSVCGFLLGVCLIHGIGGKQDFEMGKQLIELAASQGNPLASYLVENEIPFDQYFPEEWMDHEEYEN